MRCPHCEGSSQVVDSRVSDTQDSIRRRRRCTACGARFTTYERYEAAQLYVRKRDGSRQPFSREKLLAGLERAAIKRPVERPELERLADRIAAELQAEGGAPAAERIGQLALRGLKELDPVAYVRFASVYRNFGDVAEFEAELARLELEPPLQREHLFPLGRAGGDARSVRRGGNSAELPRDSVAGVAKTGIGADVENETRVVNG
jgi:transcriptional repressor NrdR